LLKNIKARDKANVVFPCWLFRTYRTNKAILKSLSTICLHKDIAYILFAYQGLKFGNQNTVFYVFKYNIDRLTSFPLSPMTGSQTENKQQTNDDYPSNIENKILSVIVS